MLDWPEQSQTSPTRTLVKIIVVPDSTTSDWGSEEAPSFLSFTVQWPWVFARVDLVCPANLTTTFAPGALQPQMGTACSRCNTILSPKMAGSFKVLVSLSATAVRGLVIAAKKARALSNSVFMNAVILPHHNAAAIIRIRDR